MNTPPWLNSLPPKWRALRLRHVASVSNSSVDKKSEDGGHPVRLCNYTDVYYNDFISNQMDLMTATATTSEIRRFGLQTGDVAITKDSETWNDIAIPACVREELDNVVCGYHLTLLRPRPDRLQGRYLLRALQAQGIREQFWVAANGVTRFGLGQLGIKDALIPLPPISTQLDIADFLDRKTAAIDALIDKKQKLLDLLAEKRAALINHAVTKGLNPDAPMKDSGIPWIGEIPAHWELTRLRSVTSFATSGSRGWADHYSGDNCDPVFLQSGNLGIDLQLDLSNIQRVRPPRGAEGRRTLVATQDILVCITGARTGTVAIVRSAPDPEAYINQHVCLLRLTPDGVDSQFIALALSSDVGQAHFKVAQYGGTKQGLGLEHVRSCYMALPPIAEQKMIGSEAWNELAQSRSAQGLIERQIDSLHEYRQALITAAVTGQLDVTQEAAA
ncbi:MAG: restriction endonuclease subunit S [Deltaproteobacteria bacterium]